VHRHDLLQQHAPGLALPGADLKVVLHKGHDAVGLGELDDARQLKPPVLASNASLNPTPSSMIAYTTPPTLASNASSVEPPTLAIHLIFNIQIYQNQTYLQQIPLIFSEYRLQRISLIFSEYRLSSANTDVSFKAHLKPFFPPATLYNMKA